MTNLHNFVSYTDTLSQFSNTYNAYITIYKFPTPLSEEVNGYIELLQSDKSNLLSHYDNIMEYISLMRSDIDKFITKNTKNTNTNQLENTSINYEDNEEESDEKYLISIDDSDSDSDYETEPDSDEQLET